MKKLLILIIALTITVTPLLAKSDLNDKFSLMTEADMYLAYKVGLKFDLNDKMSLINTFGVNLIEASQFCYSFYASYHTIQNKSSYNVDVNFGILQGVFNENTFIESNYFYINPGLTMHISYPISEKIIIGAQAGMIVMIGYDLGFWGYSLEPYAGITFNYSK